MYGPSKYEIESAAEKILSSVAERFGIQFAEVNTGGGCMALEARLESGHWIVATDDGLCDLRSRLVYEAVAREDGCDFPQGWSIGIYRNYDDDGIDTWMNGGSDNDAIVDVVDYDAFGDALPDMVGRALTALAQRRAAIDEYSVEGGARIRVRRPGFYY
jgi:hypothetical protein